MSPRDADLDLLLKLRLVIARCGELDLAGWWNTRGQLGRLGGVAVRRGFPRTASFAQARSVFAVAAERCRQVWNPPDCATLWQLPASVEDEFDARWEHWLERVAEWQGLFDQLTRVQGPDVAAALGTAGLTEDHHIEAASRLRRSAEGRAVPLAGTFSGRPDDLVMLALGFVRGGVGELAVPYLRLGEA